jgi:hypothetical protein
LLKKVAKENLSLNVLIISGEKGFVECDLPLEDSYWWVTENLLEKAGLTENFKWKNKS